MFIATSQQQWLAESASMLRYRYTDCIVDSYKGSQYDGIT